ncbi:DUF5050 domain-containing protein [Alkalihalobacterium elongatum]|uniref:DUF5050 domain-containing protein n=1 Tax=Alkalihalobacterium elongatum TaxID=2675466 RepID=UPI001C1F8D04|nr:DUF5050 domain-containing protein [Alkalihalobacterium elongatum]
MLKNKQYIYLFILILSLLLFACQQQEAVDSSIELQSDNAEEVIESTLWLVKGYDDTNSGDLYVKYGELEIEKVASDVIIGSQLPFNLGEKVLYLDGEQNLYYIEKGKEKEKISSDVMYGTYEFSPNGTKVYYINEESGLYVAAFGNEKEKLASNVRSFLLTNEEGPIYVLKDDDKLIKITDGQEKTIANDVMNFKLAEKGLIYTNNDGLLYYVNEENEKGKISNLEVVYPQISDDAAKISYLEEYNFEKGYGELVIIENGQRSKVASDIKEFELTANGSAIFYTNSDDILYVYTTANGEKVKLASDVQQYTYIDDKTIYLTKDDDLFVKTIEKDGRKIASDVYNYYVLAGHIYYISKDKDLFLVKDDGEKEKLLSDLEDYTYSNNQFYYLTKETKIGTIKLGETEGKILLDDVKDYSLVYIQNYLIYQKLVTLSDIKGYWTDLDETGYLVFEPISNEKVKLILYSAYGEMDIYELKVDYATDTGIFLVNQTGDSGWLTLKDDNTLEFHDLNSDYLTFKRSRKELFDAFQKRIKVNEMDTYEYDEEEEEIYYSTKADGYYVDGIVRNYIPLLIDAINYNDFSIVEPTLLPGSPLYNDQKKLVQNLNDKGISEYLIDYDILDIREGNNANEYLVKTYELIEIYQSDGTSEVKEFFWVYTVYDDGDKIGLSNIAKAH